MIKEISLVRVMWFVLFGDHFSRLVLWFYCMASVIVLLQEEPRANAPELYNQNFLFGRPK